MHGHIPERYGFPRKSLMDLLPEEIAQSEMDAMRRHVQREALGMREYTCAECGEVFVAYKEHKYRIDKKGKILMFCSHRCMRPTEKAEEEKYRRQVLGAWVVGDNRAKTPLEIARGNVNRCRTGLRKAEEKARNADWSALNTSQRYRLKQRIAKWSAQLLLAEMELEEVKKHDD